MTYKAQLIRKYPDQETATPDFDGQFATIEVGVPRGRLKATAPNGDWFFLRLYTNDPDFGPDAIAPSESEVASGSRRVYIPGVDTQHQLLEWDLYFDGTSEKDFESFLMDLAGQGCGVVRVPS